MEDAQSSKFSVNYIQAFEVIGRMFEVLRHEIDLSPFKVSQFQTGRPRKKEHIVFFAEKLTDGDVILFRYKDEDDKPHFFIEEKGKEVVYLLQSYNLNQNEDTYKYYLGSGEEYLE